MVINYNNNMTKLITFLEGKKTYIMGFFGIITVVLYLTHVLDANTANTLLTVFGFGGLISLRASIANLD